jgi:DNA replication initiation complex subunit (GINS family)
MPTADNEKDQEARRSVLRKLVERDGQAEFARRVGRSPGQINDMLSGRKSFGEKVARAFEKKYDPSRPRGWMDIDENAEAVEGRFGDQIEPYGSSITKEEAELIADLREILPDKRPRYLDLIREAADEARAYASFLRQRGSPPSDANIAANPATKPATEKASALGQIIDADKPIPKGLLHWSPRKSGGQK